MRKQFKWLSISIFMLGLFSVHAQAEDFQMQEFQKESSVIQDEALRAWPLLHNGRIKPFETMAREAVLYLTGSYSFDGLTPLQTYMGILIFPQGADIPLIEIRSPDLREKLGFRRDQRRVSAHDLQKSPLSSMAQPLEAKEKENRRSLSELENKTLEVFGQMMLFQQIADGAQLLAAMDPQLMNGEHAQGAEANSEAMQDLKAVAAAIQSGNIPEQMMAGQKTQNSLASKSFGADLDEQKKMVPNEILYNHLQPFRIACWLYFFVALFFFAQRIRPLGRWQQWMALSCLPLAFGVLGFYLRVSITGFAPVTNMFGTMLWVSLGLSFFALLLLGIYKDPMLSAILNFGSFGLLLITESLPLVLSPDLDPIVAVLRSNLWLTIHVLTITISYAAFTISMILGNTAMLQFLAGKLKPETLKNFSHYCYRSIQLGVLLITTGIILGGVWADYSWGRFWGWDPKETWALIADLGYISILHARYVGWTPPFRMLMLAPLSYLLVVMAWYGVNFILATGLHSYGFSSGGTAVVLTYVVIQLTLIGITFIKQRTGERKLL